MFHIKFLSILTFAFVSARRDQKFRTALGRKINALRKEQKVSQAQLAFECGITRELLSKIESGKINTTLKTLLGLTEALNIHFKDLFDFEY